MLFGRFRRSVCSRLSVYIYIEDISYGLESAHRYKYTFYNLRSIIMSGFDYHYTCSDIDKLIGEAKDSIESHIHDLVWNRAADIYLDRIKNAAMVVEVSPHE